MFLIQLATYFIKKDLKVWKICVIYPHVVPNLYDFLYSVEHKRRIVFLIQWKSVDCLVNNILQNIFFCVLQND